MFFYPLISGEIFRKLPHPFGKSPYIWIIFTSYIKYYLIDVLSLLIYLIYLILFNL